MADEHQSHKPTPQEAAAQTRPSGVRPPSESIFRTSAPAWLSALGTIALAFVAFITLNPLIENLQLRQANSKLSTEIEALTGERRSVQESLDAARERLDASEKYLARLDADVDAKREDLKRTQGQLAATQENNNRLTEMNSNLLKSYNEQTEDRRKIEAQNNEMRAANQSLKDANDVLNQQSTALTGERDRLRLDLKAAKGELDAVHLSQRVYVLDSVSKKAKGAAPQYGSAHGEEPVFWGEQGASSDPGSTYSPSRYFTEVFRAISRWKGPGANRRTGREIVRSLLDEPEFGVLAEPERRALRRDIERFMDRLREQFDANLEIDGQTSINRFETEFQPSRLRSAKESGNKVKVEDGKPDRVPTDADIRQAEEELKAAKRAYDPEAQRAQEAVEKFDRALDQMTVDLAPAGETPAKPPG